ncbi:Protein CBG22620 [Caenorhabditis briggsae]|uniref:Protein CBG22620 n=1 Tax=Caenorhabditis briggsae TaxID=6238 RepID=A8Y2P7_CAEBR|nr:Protein CBG22620 [Caenorhabditis briggsae]CAP39172.1 Protein CBG22620 [Caenorhabditis briggsae]
MSLKLGCIPVRGFLLVVSFLGMLSAPSLLLVKPLSTTSHIASVITLAFNGCLFGGALKYNNKALKCCQNVLVCLIVFYFILLCLTPMTFSRFMAYGYDQFLRYEPVEDLANRLKRTVGDDEFSHEKARKEAEAKFILGLLVGVSIVVVIIIHGLYNYMLVVMVQRLRKFIATRSDKDGFDGV